MAEIIKPIILDETGKEIKYEISDMFKISEIFLI